MWLFRQIKNFILTASASGGVWKTTDMGESWNPIFEKEISSSIGDIAIAPCDKNIIWVGTGESNIFRSSHAGCGIYKSTRRRKNLHPYGTGKFKYNFKNYYSIRIILILFL